MKIKVFILSLLLTFAAVTSQGQNDNFSLNPTMDRILPPPPNVSALMKFGSIPVGPSTGIPQITIPVYSFESKASGLKLNVSLDYHAGGIKVGEIGSNVGIGWVLNGGGAVSRTMRGIADEETGGYLNTPPVTSSESDGNAGTHIQYRIYNRVYANQLDAQPDIFNFNMNGASGGFMYGKNNDILMLNSQKVKVEKVIGPYEIMGSINSGIVKFILTDENGFRYFFDSYEVTTDLSRLGTGVRDFTSSWYLTKQLAPNGLDSIVYAYESANIGAYTIGKSEYLITGSYNPSASSKRGGSYTGAQVQGQRLKKISLPDGVTLTFDYRTENRPDLVVSYLLDKITISGNSNKRGFYLTQDFSLNRATLKKVTPFNGVQEVKMPPYQFEYDIPLPDRLSTQIDHWGFYNNNTASNNGIPGLIPRELFPEKIGADYELPGSNRDTDSLRVLAGSLKKIIYPAGGSTVFEMEPNKAYSNWLDQKIVGVGPGSDTDNRSTSAWVATGEPYKSNYAIVSFKGLPNTTANFKVTAPTSGTSNNGGKLVLEIFKPDGSFLGARDLPYSNNDGVSSSFPLQGLENLDYKFVFYTVGLTGFGTYVNVEWVEKVTPKPTQVNYAHLQPFVGGLRVKKISDFTVNGGQSIAEREYEYLTPDGKRSSGSLGVAPKYTFTVFYYWRWANLDGSSADGWEDSYIPTNPNYASRSSSSVYDLTYINGSPVTYSHVVEKQKNNGKKEYFLTSFQEGGAIINIGAPLIPADYKSWLYGLVTKELIYDKNDSLVEKTENEYENMEDRYFHDPVRFQNFKALSILPVKYYYTGINIPLEENFWQYQSGPPLYFLSKEFYPSAGRSNLIKSIKSVYDKLGNVLTTEQHSVYDNNNYYLKSAWTLNSLKDTVKTTYNYPSDLTTSVPDANVYQGMVQRNIINPPVETRRFINNRQIGLSKTNYHSPYSGLFLPKSIQVQKGNEVVETRIGFSKYDNRGRVLSMYKDNGPVIAYKWGYNSQYVIAECQNAEADEFFYEGFEETGVAGNARTGSRSYSGSFTTADKLSPGFHNKNYKISYWYYAGGAWKFSGELNYTGQALSGVLDDIRIYPENAQMTTYTYDLLFGVTSISDVRDNPTYYEYDIAGRLRAIKDKDGKILKLYDYQYLQPITQ